MKDDDLEQLAIPFVNTSRVAHQMIEQSITRLQREVLDIIDEIGPCTQHAIVSRMRARMAESSARTRVSELVKMGLVQQSSVTKLPNGRPAKTWMRV